MSDLSSLINLLEVRLATVPDFVYEDNSSWAARDSAIGKIIDDLVEREGAKISGTAWGGYALKLGGIRTSCTSGYQGLLTNWMAAARRRMAVQA